MPRLKRSERIAKAMAVKPGPAPTEVAPPKVAERLVAAICPVCGRTVPEKRAIRIGYVTVDKVDYFSSIEWDENKPFGVSYSPRGRGSMEWNYIGPEEASALFEAVRSRLIQAVREWIKKGWLTKEDILEE